MNVLLLMAAGVAAVLLGEVLDAAAIVAIVVLNVAITLLQERKATRSLESLNVLQTPTARVLRDGVTALVPAREVVPGDVIVLAAGDRVPADARLFEANAIEIDESMLTGESLPVEKNASASQAGSDRGSYAFSGSIVTTGFGHAVVTATGADTELGAIAAHLQELQPPTPLQVELGKVTARLGVGALALAVVVFVLIVWVGDDPMERAFLSAVALAVAAVPEGLATIVTIALALGVRRMADQGAIVRLLPAVETLGSTDVIVTDKTGTLTKNSLSVASVMDAAGEVLPLSEFGRSAASSLLLRAAVLCNDADPVGGGHDPLESALLELGNPFEIRSLRARCPRIGSIPFDPRTKLMATVHQCEGGAELFAKGAPEAILPRVVNAIQTDGIDRLDAGARAELLRSAAELAAGGARLIAFATRRLEGVATASDPALEDLTLIAFVALSDPVRPEARTAVSDATAAGVRVVMVTGDHPGTATAIARDVGIDPSLGAVPETPGAGVRGNVFARALPEDKVAIVAGLHAEGHVVAVTGDGVNDVPALRRADVGVAMGKGGTDAAREAADLVITDDNLATVVTAIREGRGIYDNIRKVVDYLVAANLSEVVVVIACLLAVPAIGIPLTPLQILWINLVTDGLPAVALAVHPISPDVMNRRPRSRRHVLLSAERLRHQGVRGMVLALGALCALFAARFVTDVGWGQARTTMFVALAGAQLAYSWVVARGRHAGSARHNRQLLGAIVVGAALLWIVIVVPGLRGVFDTRSLSPTLWLLALAGSLLPGTMLLFAARGGRR